MTKLRAQNRWLAKQNQQLYQALHDVASTMGKTEADTVNVTLWHLKDYHAGLQREAEQMSARLDTLEVSCKQQGDDPGQCSRAEQL